MLDDALSKTRRLIPTSLFSKLQPAYHLALSYLGALWYRFPSKDIKVIAVTGTKGKSSTVEILNAILEEAGFKTALSNTIRFKVGNDSQPNLYKMSMPGRMFAQRFIRRAVDEKCEYVVMEMTSQGALLSRHRFIELDALVFTNLSPEHIEAHGSYEKYRDSKLAIAKQLSISKKLGRAIIVNGDDAEAQKFLAFDVEKKISFGIKNAEPYQIKKEGIEFTWNGTRATSKLSGLFNLYNILAAATAAKSLGVSDDVIIRTIEKFSDIPGRVEEINAGPSSAGKQDFKVIVDYAHTPDSLEKLYKVFPTSRNICVLGGTGGGRDTWKRGEMGRIADKYCAEIILTDEDPYDEDPGKIVDDVAAGIISKKPTIIMDRREAIREALKRARSGDTVLITGKGTDPYIMSANGTKQEWSDAKVAREEVERKLKV